MAGFQIKSISQLDSIPETGTIGKLINNSNLKDFDYSSYEFSVLSCIDAKNTTSNALSIETSDRAKSYGMDLARVINPLVSAILYLYINQNQQLTKEEALSTFIPWDLNKSSRDIEDRVVSGGALNLGGIEGSENNIALSVKSGCGVQVAAENKQYAFQIYTTGKTVATDLQATKLVAGNNTEFAVNGNSTSAKNLSSTTLTANTMFAGAYGSPTSFRFNVTSTQATAANLSATNLTAAGKLTAINSESSIKFSDVSGTNLTADNFTVNTQTVNNRIDANAIYVQNRLSSAEISAVNLTADTLFAGKQAGRNPRYLLTAEYDSENSQMIAMDVERDLTAHNSIYAASLYAGTNASFSTFTLSAMQNEIKFTVLSGIELTATKLSTTELTAGSENLKVKGSDTIKINKLSAASLTGGDENLKVEGTNAISVSRLSAASLTGGDENLIVHGTSTINIASLSAKDLTAGNNNLVVQYSTPTITIASLNATNLTSNGSIAQLTAKAACWS